MQCGLGMFRITADENWLPGFCDGKAFDAEKVGNDANDEVLK